MHVATHSSIDAIAAAEWDALSPSGHPFLRHAFLRALETGGSVGKDSGWQVALLTLSDAQGLAAAAPAYIKQHSYGEFVFDFSWAQAYSRYGLNYYPKLVVAAPFTPASGPRLLVRTGLDGVAMRGALVGALQDFAHAQRLSSIHALFADAESRAAFEAAGWLARNTCQFHWNNHGYRDFDHYLESFTADKRKKAKRERRRVLESGITFQTRHGDEITASELDAAFELHRDTFLRHGHEPYLTRATFQQVARALGRSFMIKFAMGDGRPAAVAIFFISRDSLYGRYWGSRDAYHSLHFETCYHQGIDYCIENRLQHFEPGTQGEHKVSRGFEPALTHSAHYIADARFRAPIAEFVKRERDSIADYAAEIQTHVPYRDRRA